MPNFAVCSLEDGAKRLILLSRGHVAEWLRNGLQNRVPRFNSGRGLHSKFNDLEQISELAHEGQNWRWEPAGNPLASAGSPFSSPPRYLDT